MNIKDIVYLNRIESKKNEQFVVFGSGIDNGDCKHFLIVNGDTGKQDLTEPMSLPNALKFFRATMKEFETDEYPFYLDYTDDLDWGFPETEDYKEVFKSSDYIRAYRSFGCGDYEFLTVVSVDNFKKIEFDKLDDEYLD